MGAAERIARFWSKVNRSPDALACWEWQGARFATGYGMFNAGRFAGRQDTRYAHRVAYELTQGPIPPGLVVRHRCDKPLCCNPAHLLVGTDQDNVNDAKRQGKYVAGARRRWARVKSDVQKVA